MDLSDEQKRFLEGGERKWISSRWNGKSTAYRITNHLKGLCNPVTCPHCQAGRMPRGDFRV